MLYTEDDILTNVQQINNILNDTHFLQLKNIINDAPISRKDIFKNNNFYYINLLNNNYVTDTIFNAIKNKFNYNGKLEDVFCNIQSHTDNQKYKNFSEDLNYTIFSLDINQSSSTKNINLENILHIIKDKNDDPTNLNQDFAFNSNDPLLLPANYNITPVHRDFYCEKQNFMDSQGYLYFIPSCEYFSTGFAYEHINNNCIKFPGHYFHKTKTYARFNDANRISVLFICKNI
jgi:hypothetical protein